VTTMSEQLLCDVSTCPYPAAVLVTWRDGGQAWPYCVLHHETKRKDWRYPPIRTMWLDDDSAPEHA
jgi:hypothetical protein